MIVEETKTRRRLPKMSRVDAVAFLATAIAVMSVNAVLAVAIGCSCYAVRAVYSRYRGPERVPEPAVNG